MRGVQRSLFCIGVLTFAVWSASPSLGQTTYWITDLGTIPGGTFSEAYGINAYGQVTGSSGANLGNQHAFLYSAGTMTDLGTLPGFDASRGSGINVSGQVAGSSFIFNTFNEHAFLYSAGTMTDLGTLPGGTASNGFAINDAGQVTGNSSTSGIYYAHAFLDSGGTMTDLGTLPGGCDGETSSGSGINASGQVTGQADLYSDDCSYFVPQAMLYSAGTMTNLGSLDGGWSQGLAINDSGQVTGWSFASGTGTVEHAFLYSAGTMTDLGTFPGGTDSEGYGINNLGQVVGFSDTNGGYSPIGFVYTPGVGMVWLGFLFAATAINDSGQITGYGSVGGAIHAFLLTPTGLITPQENPCGCPSGNPSEAQVAGAQGGSADPVNTAFGSFFEQFDDITVAGRGLPLSFTHTYSSVFAGVNGALGYGWTHSYNMNLVQNSAGVVTITQENGSQVTFNPASGGGYTALPRVIATLVKNSDGTFTFTRRAQEFFTFSATGQLTAERDRNGYTTTLAYNGSNQLTTITDPAGRSLNLTYSGAQLASITDPLARTVQFAYDGSGNLATVTDVNGGKTGFTYSPGHLLLTITDPKGGVVTNTYDASNRVISQSDQLGRITTLAYALGITTTTDPAGHVTQELYNSFNQRTSLTRGFGSSSAATWTFTYDPSTQGIASITDPNGHVSSTTYDASGNPLTSTDGLGRVTTRTFDTMNDLTSVTDPLKVTTTLTYDANGNLLTRSTPLTGSSKLQTDTYQYGDSTHPGDVTGIVDPLGKTTTFTYDADGDCLSSTDPLKHVTKFGYNGIGWLTSLTDARGETTNYTRDSFGDLTVTTDPLGDTTTRAYDANRNLTSLTDSDGRVTAYTYDAANELTTTTRADGTTLQTAYNPDGTVAQTSDGKGNATTYAYNPLAQPISVTDPLLRTTSYGYDGVGDLLTLTDASGQITTNSYDAANQRVSIAYSDGKTPNVTLAYDADSQRISMTDGTGTSSWTYDSLHRVTATSTGAGAKVSYAYDLKNQLTGITYPGGAHKVTRAYDAAGRLTAITDWLNNKTIFTYDSDANLTGETLPSTTKITSTLSYDAASRLTGIVDALGTTSLATFAYTRDGNGQLTGASETGVPVPGTDTYGYTPLNQLASVNSSSYSYDPADNITGIIVPTQLTLQYDAANELTSLKAGNTTATFAFDTRGNRLSRTPHTGKGTTYAYDQANRMVGFGAAETYTYAGDGLRMAKTLSGRSEAFTWDRSHPLPLLLRDGATSYIYDPQGLPLEQITSAGAALFYLHDQLGSIRLLTNSSGAVQNAYTYDAYGNVLGKTGTLANPFGYAGQYTDSESGLLYLRARYYDPSTAQFVSRDPLVAITQEAYAYADDNPLNGIDPTGLNFFTALWKATFGSTSPQTQTQVTTAVTTAVSNAATKDSPLPLPIAPDDVKAAYNFSTTVAPQTAIKDIYQYLQNNNLSPQEQADAEALLQQFQALPPGGAGLLDLENNSLFRKIRKSVACPSRARLPGSAGATLKGTFSNNASY